MLSFYAGIGLAIVILFSKAAMVQMLSRRAANDPWMRMSLPLLASNFAMLGFWFVGMRVVFAMPLELRANWIFRVTQTRAAMEYRSATRRAVYVLSLAPVWIGAIVLLLLLWPWRLVLEHAVILALVVIVLSELSLRGFDKIPFTCSYLPGRSNLHITFVLCIMLGLNVTFWCANFERRILFDRVHYAETVAGLCVAAWVAWWANRPNTDDVSGMKFEEEQAPVISSLGLVRDGVMPIK